MRNAEWSSHVSFTGIVSLGNLLLCRKGKLSSQLFTHTFHQLGLLILQRCLRIRALASPRLKIEQYPRWRMVAGVYLPTRPSVYTTVRETVR
jgi:hypothetical protein